MLRRNKNEQPTPVTMVVDEELLAELDAVLADVPTSKTPGVESMDVTSEAEDLAALLSTGAITVKPSQRHTAAGSRRGRHRFAAPLGLCVILLALTGVVALVWGMVAFVQHSTDTTALREEMDEFLYPLARYAPAPFEDINAADGQGQDALILAAIHSVVGPILSKQSEGGGISLEGPYPPDEYGRLMVPLGDIDKAYAAFFGNSAKPNYRTIGAEESSGEDDDLPTSEWEITSLDRDNSVYHVPLTATGQSGYYPKVTAVTSKNKVLTVRMAYVPEDKVERDNRDQLIIDPAKAGYYQEYTLHKTTTGAYIVTRIRNVK